MTLSDFHDLCNKLRSPYKKEFNHLGIRLKVPTLEDKLSYDFYHIIYATHEFIGYFVNLRFNIIGGIVNLKHAFKFPIDNSSRILNCFAENLKMDLCI